MEQLQKELEIYLDKSEHLDPKHDLPQIYSFSDYPQRWRKACSPIGPKMCGDECSLRKHKAIAHRIACLYLPFQQHRSVKPCHRDEVLLQESRH